MAHFDVSKKWTILAPVSVPAAGQAAGELAAYIGLLRGRAGSGKTIPPVEDAEKVSPPDSVPIIILNAGTGSRDRNGYTWRLGKDRLEIFGDSDRGLCSGVFDFLAALGIRWPAPGREELPQAAADGAGVYALKEDKAYFASADSPVERRRLVVNEKTRGKELEEIIRWAARNKYDAAALPLRDRALWKNLLQKDGKIRKLIESYALIVEAGGWDLSLLVPRSLFLFHPGLFRMDSGRRTKKYNFCATNPKTIELIKKNAADLFGRAIQADGPGKTGKTQAVPVFHLWPDREHETVWCSCPACRAFSPQEQNRIAANAAADALSAIAPTAKLSYFESSEAGGISMRPNTFAITTYPDEV